MQIIELCEQGFTGGEEKQYFTTHTCTKMHSHPYSKRKASSGEENSNEAKLCNILNLAAGLPTQVSVHIAPSFLCVSLLCID